MAGINRREFARLTGAATVAMLTMRGLGAHAATAAEADVLGHVMPELRPAARQLLGVSDRFGALDDKTIAAVRKLGGPPSVPPIPDVSIRSVQVPVGKGMPDVTVYVINEMAGAKRPAILHTHGGGYILGTAKGELRRLQDVARELDCVIVTVDYRLAPETRYTGSVEDNYAGLRWMYVNAAQLGIDQTRIAVMGESAGGGHAALLAIAARDRGEVPLVLQVLIYPMLDDRTGSSVSVPPFIGTLLWTPAANRYGWKAFLGQEPGTPNVPAAGVPARVANLTGLAPAFVAVGGIDLFVSEDVEYARRLTEAGVPTDLLVVPGAFHAFDAIAAETAIARRFTKAKMDAFRRAFGQAVPD